MTYRIKKKNSDGYDVMEVVGRLIESDVTVIINKVYIYVPVTGAPVEDYLRKLSQSYKSVTLRE